MRCATCGGPLPDGLPPNARYCSHPCRLRAKADSAARHRETHGRPDRPSGIHSRAGKLANSGKALGDPPALAVEPGIGLPKCWRCGGPRWPIFAVGYYCSRACAEHSE